MLRQAVGVAAVLVLTAGCTSAEQPGARGSSGPTPDVRSLDLSDLPIARAPFCDLVDPGGVRQALEAPVASSRSYEPGDTAEMVPGYTDVSDEYSCTFATANDSQARVWVFAAPVTKAKARGLARAAARTKGCQVPPSIRFGTPTITTLCEQPGDPVRTAATMSGLFGDTWLSCQVSRPHDGVSTRGNPWEVLAQARQWCVDVVTTLGARP